TRPGYSPPRAARSGRSTPPSPGGPSCRPPPGSCRGRATRSRRPGCRRRRPGRPSGRPRSPCVRPRRSPWLPCVPPVVSRQWVRSHLRATLGAVLTADVCVVGGGPAGAAAAITLARAGRGVVVVDRARFPRDKCCGDGLTAGALRQLEDLGLRPELVPSWQRVDDVWVRSPSGRTVRFPLPRGQGVFAAVAERADLDAALLDVARAAGAKVHDGH